jgi:hypothetical protein
MTALRTALSHRPHISLSFTFLAFSSHFIFYFLLIFFSFIIFPSSFLLSEGKAEEIDCTYVSSGQPLDVTAYVKSKQGFGKSFVDFFSDGGLIKFNPFK